MDIVYTDDTVLVCVKPAGVLSTDEPGGLPALLRETLGDRNADVRTVHRLDRAVSGLIVLARGKAAASAHPVRPRRRLSKKSAQPLSTAPPSQMSFTG